MIYELKEYRIREGYRQQWVRLMEEVILPFQESCGMEIVGRFVSLEDSVTYVWIRKFTDESRRRQLYDAVYGSPYWQSVVRPAMGDMLIRDARREIRLKPAGEEI